MNKEFRQAKEKAVFLLKGFINELDEDCIGTYDFCSLEFDLLYKALYYLEDLYPEDLV